MNMIKDTFSLPLV